MRGWYYNPHVGGKKIPPGVQDRVRKRILAYAAQHYAGGYTRIDVRFRGALCYIDAYVEPDVPEDFPPKDWHETRDEYLARLRATPIHLCRIRYFGDEDRWSIAFYLYSHNKYEPSFFPSGDDHGTPEEAFEIGASFHLDDAGAVPAAPSRKYKSLEASGE